MHVNTGKQDSVLTRFRGYILYYPLTCVCISWFLTDIRVKVSITNQGVPGSHLPGDLRYILKACCFLPADVVGLAGGLQFETVGSLFFFVRADGNDGLTPAFRTCCLVTKWA